MRKSLTSSRTSISVRKVKALGLLALFAACFAFLPREKASTHRLNLMASSRAVQNPNTGYKLYASRAPLKSAISNSPHVLPASYYSLRGDLRTTLTLNNKGAEPLDIQPTLFSLSGQRLDLPPVTVDGTSFRVIDLRQWVTSGAGFDEGSLQIVHYGMDMQLGAQVKLIDAD